MYLTFLFVGAVAAGILAAVWSIGRKPSSPVKNGPWQHNPLLGSTAANAYLRARMAWLAPLGMNRSEAIYLFAWQDDDGNALHSREDYLLVGEEYDALWWSVTAQGTDGYLIPNDGHRYSYTRSTVERDSDNRFSIYMSSKRQSSNWLPTGSGRFGLILRFYQPSDELREQIQTAPLPNIRRISKS